MVDFCARSLDMDCLSGAKCDTCRWLSREVPLTNDTPGQLAQDHWTYTERLLTAAGVEVTELHKFLYIEAMTHGYKHGKGDKND